MSDLVTRRLDPDADQRDLVGLFELVFGHTVLPGMWEWKHMPPWAPRHECWVAEYDDRIVGYVGAMCLRGVVDGRSVPFFQLGDAMVHPDYRRRFDYFDLGARHIFEDVAMHHEERVIYGFSNHRAFLWFKKMGIGDMVERARQCTVRPRPAGQVSSGGLTFVETPWQDDVVDALWAEHQPTLKLGLLRDREYLQWRYGRHPAYRYWLHRIEDRGVPVGWVVRGQHGGKPATPIVDMLLPAGREQDLLQAFADHVDRPICCWLPGGRTPAFAEEKETKTSVYVFIKETTVGIEQLRSDLYYTMGDADWW
jgi:hypothetical protein